MLQVFYIFESGYRGPTQKLIELSLCTVYCALFKLLVFIRSVLHPLTTLLRICRLLDSEALASARDLDTASAISSCLVMPSFVPRDKRMIKSIKSNCAPKEGKAQRQLQQ